MDFEKSIAEASCGYVRPQNRSSRAIVWVVFLLLAVTSWARGGSSDITPWLQFVLGCVVAVVFLWEVMSCDYKGFAGGIFRDPVMYIGLLVLLLLGVQWANSGRELYYDAGRGAWLYTDPPSALLPYAFNSGEAMEVWIWFFCAWVVLLAVRSSLMSRLSVYRLWKFMLINACFLGLFGMVQFLSGTDRIFWITRLPYQRFFASFGYSNHAGAYFVLALYLALAMLVRRVFRYSPPRFTLKTFFLLIASVLLLLCANLTLSRFAILASWVGVTCSAAYVARRLWRRGGPALKVNLVVLMVCAGVAAVYASFACAGAMLGKELVSFLRLHDDLLGMGRLAIFKAGLSVWSEGMWFGVGPWGFRHLVGLHLDESLHFLLMPGSASLHNDLLQYLVESGVVGVSLMVSVIFIMVRNVRVGILKTWVPGVILYGGLLAIGLQSMFDLPMRSPAVFYFWLAVLAGADKVLREKAAEMKSGNVPGGVPEAVVERKADS